MNINVTINRKPRKKKIKSYSFDQITQKHDDDAPCGIFQIMDGENTVSYVYRSVIASNTALLYMDDSGMMEALEIKENGTSPWDEFRFIHIPKARMRVYLDIEDIG